MTDLISGILLPDSILRTTWFFYLAAFVAFNTIIFVGLSVAKLVLWPRPAIPADVTPEPDIATYRRRRRYGDMTPREESRLADLSNESLE